MGNENTVTDKGSVVQNSQNKPSICKFECGETNEKFKFKSERRNF